MMLRMLFFNPSLQKSKLGARVIDQFLEKCYFIDATILNLKHFRFVFLLNGVSLMQVFGQGRPPIRMRLLDEPVS
jgi:hypothetical protein